MKVEIGLPFGLFYQCAASEAGRAMEPTVRAVLAEHGLTLEHLRTFPLTGKLVPHDDYPDETTVELVWTLELPDPE